MPKTDKKDTDKYNLAHYSATVAAWFNTRLEHDKSLLTLSSAGIGLLISLASRRSILSFAGPSLWIAIVFWLLSLASFITCTIAVLQILKSNSKHLEDVITADAKSDPRLEKLDAMAIKTFVAGIVFASAFGVAVAVSIFDSRGSFMSTKDDRKSPGTTVVGDSFNRAANMQKSRMDTISKSYNGASALKKPSAPPPQNTSKQSQTPSPSPGQTTKKP